MTTPTDPGPSAPRPDAEFYDQIRAKEAERVRANKERDARRAPPSRDPETGR